MRVYFQLVSGSETIRDEKGVEGSRVREARAEALKVVREAQGDGAALRESAGWRLRRATIGGRYCFPLTSVVPAEPRFAARC